MATAASSIPIPAPLAYHKLPYSILRLAGIRCDVGRPMDIKESSEQTDCNYAEQNGEHVLECKTYHRVYCRGYRRYVCDCDCVGSIGFCYVCLNFIKSSLELLSECKTPASVTDIGANVQHEQPVVVVCGTCRPKLPTEKKQLPVYLKSLGYGKDVEHDLAEEKYAETIFSMMLKDLGKVAPVGVSKQSHDRFRINGPKWMHMFSMTQWTSEKIKALELPPGEHSWESKYAHWSDKAFDCSLSLSSSVSKPKMIVH